MSDSKADSLPQRTITQVIAKLREYVQHNIDCAVHQCAVCPNEDLWHWRNGHHARVPKPCTCGLDDLAAVLSVSPEQQEQEIMVSGAAKNETEGQAVQRPTTGNPAAASNEVKR